MSPELKKTSEAATLRKYVCKALCLFEKLNKSFAIHPSLSIVLIHHFDNMHIPVWFCNFHLIHAMRQFIIPLKLLSTATFRVGYFL